MTETQQQKLSIGTIGGLVTLVLTLIVQTIVLARWSAGVEGRTALALERAGAVAEEIDAFKAASDQRNDAQDTRIEITDRGFAVIEQKLLSTNEKLDDIKQILEGEYSGPARRP